MKAETDIVYWALTAFPVILLACQLVPLVPRGGVWFFTTPTRDQWVTLGLFAFLISFGVFGVRRESFVVFVALAGLAVLLQSWGPKRFHRGRVYGATIIPSKIKGWVRQNAMVMVRLSWGTSVALPSTPQNQPFLKVLEDQSPEGEGLD